MLNTEIKENKIESLVRRQVVGVLREVLSDPDRGLALTQTAVKRLKKSIRSKKSGKYRSLSEVIKKYSR